MEEYLVNNNNNIYKIELTFEKMRSDSIRIFSTGVKTNLCRNYVLYYTPAKQVVLCTLDDKLWLESKLNYNMVLYGLNPTYIYTFAEISSIKNGTYLFIQTNYAERKTEYLNQDAANHNRAPFGIVQYVISSDTGTVKHVSELVGNNMMMLGSHPYRLSIIDNNNNTGEFIDGEDDIVEYMNKIF